MLKIFTNAINNIFVTTILIACIIGCSSEKEAVLPDAKVSELKTYVEKHYIDSTDKLDSFRVAHLDTVTAKDRLTEIMGDYVFLLKRAVEEQQYLAKLVKSQAQIANLTNGLSSSLYSTYKSDAEDNLKKMKEYEQFGKDLNKSFDSIEVLQTKADSVAPIAYYAVCPYQVRKDDMSVKKDTFNILLNLEKNIIRRKDFINFDEYPKLPER